MTPEELLHAIFGEQEQAMNNPAEDAAQRAWDANQLSTWPSQNAVAGALEALKPIRELHHKYRLHELATANCHDSRHDVFEDLYGEWCCRTCTTEDIFACMHCSELDSNSEWPCETAKLAYSTEELSL